MNRFILIPLAINCLLSLFVAIFFSLKGDRFWRVFAISLVFSCLGGLIFGMRAYGTRNRTTFKKSMT